MPESGGTDSVASPNQQYISDTVSCTRLPDPSIATIDQLQSEHVDESTADRTTEADTYALTLQIETYKHRNDMLEERIAELDVGLQELQAEVQEPPNDMHTALSKKYHQMLKIMKSQVALVQKNADIISSSLTEEISSLMEEKVRSELVLLNQRNKMEGENRKLRAGLLNKPFEHEPSQGLEVPLQYELQRLRDENQRLKKSQSSLSGSMGDLQRENAELRRLLNNAPTPAFVVATGGHHSRSQESEEPIPNHEPRSEDSGHETPFSHVGRGTVELSVSQQALEMLQDEVCHVVHQIKAKDITIFNLKAELEEYKSREHAFSGRLKRNCHPSTSNSLLSLHQEESSTSACGSSDFEETTIDDTFWEESMYEEITVA